MHTSHLKAVATTVTATDDYPYLKHEIRQGLGIEIPCSLAPLCDGGIRENSDSPVYRNLVIFYMQNSFGGW